MSGYESELKRILEKLYSKNKDLRITIIVLRYTYLEVVKKDGN